MDYFLNLIQYLVALLQRRTMGSDLAPIHADPTTLFFMLAISLLVSFAVQPKATPPKPAAFEDFDFPQHTEGTAQIVIFGKVWVNDWMVLGVGNYRTAPIQK